MDRRTGSRHHLESHSSSHSPTPEQGEIDPSFKTSPSHPSPSPESVLSSLNGPLSVAPPTQRTSAQRTSLSSSHVYPQANELAGYDKGANRHFSWQAGPHSRDMPLERPYHHHHHHNDTSRVRDTSPTPPRQATRQSWTPRADGHQHPQHDHHLIQRHPYPVTERRKPSSEQWDDLDDVPSNYRARVEFQDVHSAQDTNAPGASVRPHTHESNTPEREHYAQARPTFETHEEHYHGRSPSQELPSQIHTRSDRSNYRHNNFEYYQDVNWDYRGPSFPYMFREESHSNSYRPPTQRPDQSYTGHPQSVARRSDRSYPAPGPVSRDRPPELHQRHHPYRSRNTSGSPEPPMVQDTHREPQKYSPRSSSPMHRQQHPQHPQHYPDQGRVSPHESAKPRNPEPRGRTFSSGFGIQRTNASERPAMTFTVSRQDSRGVYSLTSHDQHRWTDQEQRYMDQSGRSDGTTSPYESTRDHVATRASIDGLRPGSDYREYDRSRVKRVSPHRDGNLDDQSRRPVFSPDPLLHVERSGRANDWTPEVIPRKRSEPEDDLSIRRHGQHRSSHQDGLQQQLQQHDPTTMRNGESPPVRLDFGSHAQQSTTPVRSSPSQHLDYMSPCASSTPGTDSSSSSLPTHSSTTVYHDTGRLNYNSSSSGSRNSDRGHIHSPSRDQGSPLRLGGPVYHRPRDTNTPYRRYPVQVHDEGGPTRSNPLGGNDSGQRWGGTNDSGGGTSGNRVSVDNIEGTRGGRIEQRRDTASDGKWKKEETRDGRSPSTGLDGRNSISRTQKRSVGTESGTEDTEEDAGHNDIRCAQEGMFEEEDGQGGPDSRALKRKGPANDTSRTNSSPEGGPLDDGNDTTTGKNPRGTRTKENRNHQCPACGKRFSRPSQLKTHSFTHSGERPHQCPTCQKFFNVPSNLKRHIRTHSADTKRKCSKTGSNVFRTFDHVYPTRLDHGSSDGTRSGNDNGDPASESLASSSTATAPRRQPSGHVPATERLRWMNTETPFSGSIANRKRASKKKAVRKQDQQGQGQGQEQGQGSGSSAVKTQRSEALEPSSSSGATLRSSPVATSTVESVTNTSTTSTSVTSTTTVVASSATHSATTGNVGSLHLIGAEPVQEPRAGSSSLPTLSVSGSPSSVSGDTVVDPTPESTSSDTEKEE